MTDRPTDRDGEDGGRVLLASQNRGSRSRELANLTGFNSSAGFEQNNQAPTGARNRYLAVASPDWKLERCAFAFASYSRSSICAVTSTYTFVEVDRLIGAPTACPVPRELRALSYPGTRSDLGILKCKADPEGDWDKAWEESWFGSALRGGWENQYRA